MSGTSLIRPKKYTPRRVKRETVEERQLERERSNTQGQRPGTIWTGKRKYPRIQIQEIERNSLVSFVHALIFFYSPFLASFTLPAFYQIACYCLLLNLSSPFVSDYPHLFCLALFFLFFSLCGLLCCFSVALRGFGKGWVWTGRHFSL